MRFEKDMNIITKEKALALLKKSFDEVSDLKDIHDWHGWGRNIKLRTDAIFGINSNQVQEIKSMLSSLSSESNLNSIELYYGKRIISMLHSFYLEIQDLWYDDGVEKSGNLYEKTKNAHIKIGYSRDIFVVHGHDHNRLETLASFLKSLDLNPIVLHERASTGDTVIEKLERHSGVEFAIILLTPDDVGSVASHPKKLNPRARQNVILELGYFMGRLGRRRTCALVVEGVEIPSDYSGVVYIPMDIRGSWKYSLVKELQATGLSIDISRIF